MNLNRKLAYTPTASNILFGIAPSYILYLIFYSVTHDLVVIGRGGRAFTGVSLHIFTAVLIIIYFLYLQIVGNKFSKNSNKRLLGFNKEFWISGIIMSIIYLPLVAFLSSGANPW